jgi:flagellin
MRINTNVAALNSYNQLNNTNNKLSKSLERLSSGKRINGAADDAAGLAISEKMNAQTRGLAQAQRNAQDGISMIQTAEGALKESHSILQRMRELSVQSANDTNTSEDRAEIQKEVDELAKELTRISNNTEFNTQTLLNGAVKSNGLGEATFQIGSNKDQNINLSVNAMDAGSLGVAGLSAGADGNGDVTEASASGSANAIVDGNTITATTSEVAATAASVTGSDISGTFGTNLSATSFDLNGETVALTNVDGLDGSDTPFAISDAVSALQSDINAVYDGTAFGGTTFTVGNTGDALTITNDATGSSSEVNITANADTATLGLTSDATTDASATGEDITYSIALTDTEGSTTDTITGLAADATSASGSGDFAGLDLTLDGALADSEVSQITIDTATAADFTGGVTTDAVTDSGIDVSSQEAANNAISTIDDAIKTVSAERSKLGAYQNRLDHTINNLNTAEENLTAAESRISDVDMAREMMNMSKQQILSQAGTAMMAQANQLPQGVLQLLG